MDDLISRQEALYILDEEKREMENCLAQETDKNVMQYEDGYLAAVEKIAFSIKNSLGTEARRCKDCRHRYLKNNTWHCPFGLSSGEDFFCGYSVQPSELSGNMSGTHNSLDCISRQAAIDAINHICPVDTEYDCTLLDRVDVRCVLSDLPSVQPKDYECWGCNCKKMEAQLSEEDATKDATFDCISRRAAINAMWKALHEYEDNTEKQFQESDELDVDDWIVHRGFVQDMNDIDRQTILNLPSVQPEIIHCCDCIYYDPEHIENNGVRYEYRDMPKDAFDILGTGLVNSEYGINVGGRCCRDYNVGYSEDKRVFVSGQNYCGRAERRQNG